MGLGCNVEKRKRQHIWPCRLITYAFVVRAPVGPRPPDTHKRCSRVQARPAACLAAPATLAVIANQ